MTGNHRDKGLKVEIARVHRENYAVSRACEVWLQYRREGIDVAHCIFATRINKPPRYARGLSEWPGVFGQSSLHPGSRRLVCGI
ncbi:hypothetical protein P3H80_08660 [Mycolicibacterium septicum]|uniref:hypothetical protein n=1 Tax=Mycolicibacterium septicum TaxID=98668 RepID=UPI0023E1A835|nr:hypothetical protein [Mycolicibacterium septicum]MDF3337489.1 hypothetical protein [Mycolicibacterium septicum]